MGPCPGTGLPHNPSSSFLILNSVLLSGLIFISVGEACSYHSPAASLAAAVGYLLPDAASAAAREFLREKYWLWAFTALSPVSLLYQDLSKSRNYSRPNNWAPCLLKRWRQWRITCPCRSETSFNGDSASKRFSNVARVGGAESRPCTFPTEYTRIVTISWHYGNCAGAQITDLLHWPC